MAPSQLGIFTTSSPDHERANIEFHVQPLSLDKFGEPLHRFPAITVSACNLRPTSRGTIRLRSADPAAKPVIAPNYLSTPEDRRVAADAIRVTRRLMQQPALQPYRPEEYPARSRRRRRRCLAGQGRRRHRHHDLPSGRHGEDGPAVRPDGGGRRAAARHRPAGAARDRRLGDADASPRATPTRRPS